MPLRLYTGTVILLPHVDRLVRARRSPPPRRPRVPARAPARGRRDRRPAAADAARHLEAPPRAAGSRARVGAARGSAADVCARDRADGRAGRLARALSAAVVGPARRPRAPPRPTGQGGGVAMHGTFETDDGRPTVRFE